MQRGWCKGSSPVHGPQVPPLTEHRMQGRAEEGAGPGAAGPTCRPAHSFGTSVAILHSVVEDEERGEGSRLEGA